MIVFVNENETTALFNSNITWHPSLSRHERNELRGQRGLTIWFTGLSASGKSTIAKTVATRLHEAGGLGASFFFSREHESRRKLDLVFSTLASQLASHSPHFCAALTTILKKDPNLRHASPIEQLKKLIINPLNSNILYVPDARK